MIRNYILRLFGNTGVTFGDGRKAIVDGRDAEHISHKASGAKIAEISKFRDIFKKAKLIKDDFRVEHKKFTHFAYYETKVKYGKDTMALVINVGKGKNDGVYHVYELNHPKIRNTAGRINGLSQPGGNAIASGVPDNMVTQNKPIVNNQ